MVGQGAGGEGAEEDEATWERKSSHKVLPGLTNFESNTYSVDNCHFDNDKFKIDNEFYLLLIKTANDG